MSVDKNRIEGVAEQGERARNRKALVTKARWRRWLRHRLRAIQLKHWRRPGTIYRELKVLRASEDVAKQVAGNCRRWWRNSDRLLKTVLTIAYFDRLGVPRLS